MLRRRVVIASTIAGTVLLVAGCSKTDSSSADSAQVSAAVSPAPADTGMGSMGSMDHSAMQSTPARDADQEFVRMMVDHHQGLIALADTALSKNPSEHIRMDAREMAGKQRAEQKKMIAMLKQDYGEDKMPMIMPGNAQMISDIAPKAGKDFDRAFREKVIAHHEEALKMVDDFMPRFTRPAVRAMATRMKADQQKEIAELKSELKEM